MYENEYKALGKMKESLADQELSLTEMREDLIEFTENYERLLNDIQFITKISDRLQNRLQSINEDLVEQKQQLEAAQTLISIQNDELRQAKEDLELKVAERTQEVMHAYNELLISKHELDTFVYRASHDLQGPIARITGLCNVAMLDVKDPTALVYLNMLQNTSEQLDNIFNRLLSINKVKHRDAEIEQVTFISVIEKLLRLASAVSGFSEIAFSVAYPTTLRLQTDWEFFEMLLQNLLEYAIKNTIFGETNVKPFIRLTFSKQAEALLISIAYHGIVIGDEQRKDIFNLFHRMSNHPDNTGMEMYMVSLVCEKLEGKVELIASDQHETVFSVLLPNIILE